MGYLSIVDSCLYPSDVGGKDFVTRPGRKMEKNENTNSTSPRVRLFQDISNPLFKIQFCNVFRLQLKLHQHLRCGESVFLL